MTIAAEMPVGDGELVRRIGTGDRDALAALYDRHAAAAFAHALRITGDRARAEDVVEATFLGLWSSSGDVSSVPDAQTTVLMLVHRHAIAIVRGRPGVPGTVPSARLASV